MSIRDRAVLDELELGLTLVLRGLRKLRSREDWVDQTSSPLGRSAHLAAVRSGKLAGHRVGQLVLVRREDLDRYIEARRVVPKTETVEDDASAVAEVISFKAGTRRRRKAS